MWSSFLPSFSVLRLNLDFSAIGAECWGYVTNLFFFLTRTTGVFKIIVMTARREARYVTYTNISTAADVSVYVFLYDCLVMSR